jgi:hypothetical protein
MKQRRVDRAEGRRVCGDSKRDGEESHCREARASRQHSNSEADVLQHCFHNHISDFRLAIAKLLCFQFARPIPDSFFTFKRNIGNRKSAIAKSISFVP